MSVCHIKIGARSLCQCGPYHHLLGGVEKFFALLRRGVIVTCSYADEAEAQRVVDLLHAHGTAARIVPGPCDQQGLGELTR